MVQAHEPGPQISAAGDNRGRFCRAEIRGHAGKRNRVEPLRDLRVIGNGHPLAGPPRLLQLLMDIIHALRKRLAQTPPRIGALRQTPP